jgi:hypothetical protein
MKLAQGNGGWYRVTGVGFPGPVYFRIQDIGDGRRRMTELYIDGRGAPITAGALRGFPIQWLTHRAAEMTARADRSGIAGPDISRLAAHFASMWTAGARARHWVRDSFEAQMPGSSVTQARMPKERLDEDDENYATVSIESPADGRLTDEFLRDVAAAYKLAINRREPPAKTIAAAAHVSDRTVHRWVYTARKRGLMEPAKSRGRIA